jgi:hypothetical protein
MRENCDDEEIEISADLHFLSHPEYKEWFLT